MKLCTGVGTPTSLPFLTIAPLCQYNCRIRAIRTIPEGNDVVATQTSEGMPLIMSLCIEEVAFGVLLARS